jgi:integrase
MDDLPDAVQDFLLDNAYAEGTRDAYGRLLADYLATIGGKVSEDAVTKASVRRWLAGHDTWGNSTRWMGYIAVRSLASHLWGDDHPVMDLKIKRGDSPVGRTLTVSQARQLYTWLESKARAGGWSDKYRRDLAMYSLFIDTGLRSFEVCGLDMSHLDMEKLRLKTRVKGGDWGAAIFSDRTAANLDDWYDARLAVAGDTDAVFVGVGGSKPGHRLTTGGLRAIVRKWGKGAGVGKLSPHVFRRTFATLATLGGAPSRMVQLAGRWSRIEEVERYTQALTLDRFDEYLPSDMINYERGNDV